MVAVRASEIGHLPEKDAWAFEALKGDCFLWSLPLNAERLQYSLDLNVRSVYSNLLAG